MARKKVDSFILDKRLGGGSYGEVWRGRDLAHPQITVALRCVQRNVETNIARLRNEVRLLRRVSHTNVLGFHGLRKSSSHFYLALEYCAGGTLAQLLRTRGPLPEADSWRLAVQITDGLRALHVQSFVHGNLQPRNVLLSGSSEEPKVKLANFAIRPEPTPYAAPEVLLGEPCNFQSDMWSFGAILYEMLLGRTPFRGDSRSQLLASHASNEVSFATEHAVTAEGQAFCRSLLGHRCSERLSSSECASHDYVRHGPLRPECSQQDTLARTHAWFSFMLPVLPEYLQATFRFGELPFARMWVLDSAHITCSKMAQRFLNMLGVRDSGGLLRASRTTDETEVELDSELDGKLALSRRSFSKLGPGGRLDRSLNRDPVTCFFVGQLQYSHLFRFRTARLFPRVLYGM